MRSPLAAIFGAAAPALILALALGSGAARAHEGHSHGDDAPAPPAATAPRGASSSSALELVAVARNGALTVFLDRRDTNEPVTDAVVRAETPDGAATAAPMPDGSYRLDAHWSARPGEHEVLFEVAQGGESDIFPVVLSVAATPAPEPPGGFAAWSAGLAVAHDFQHHLAEADPLPFLIGGGGFVLGVAATLLMRGRPRSPRS